MQTAGRPAAAVSDRVTSNPVARFHLPPLGHDIIARLKAKGTAGMEAAIAGWIDRARHVPANDRTFALPLLARNEHWHSLQQRMGIRVLGIAEQVLLGRHFHHASRSRSNRTGVVRVSQDPQQEWGKIYDSGVAGKPGMISGVKRVSRTIHQNRPLQKRQKSRPTGH